MSTMRVSKLQNYTLARNFSWRAQYLYEGMIQISYPSPIGRPTQMLPMDPALSSLGRLDALPIEIQRLIVGSLDIQSITRFGQASHLAKATVESMRAYRLVLKHAKGALTALVNSGLIREHSLMALNAELHTEKCRYCGDFGPWLFLPTCERCCYCCLLEEPMLKVLQRRTARVCFKLPLGRLRKLPTLMSIPGTHYLGSELTPQRQARQFILVAWKHVKELALDVHGSAEELTEIARQAKITDNENYAEHCQMFWLVNEERETDWPTSDPLLGMAVVDFPAVVGEWAQYGIWCRGCRHASLQKVPEFLFRDQHAPLLGPLRPTPEERRCFFRAFSVDGFLKHVRQCREAEEALREGSLKGE